MNIKTIEQRIIEQADRKTNERIDQVINSYANSVAPDYHKPIKVSATMGGMPVEVSLNHRGLVSPLLRAILEDAWRETNRKKELDDFVNKVDRLAHAYEELGIYREEQQS